jgi:hypothetical protein
MRSLRAAAAWNDDLKHNDDIRITVTSVSTII